MYLSISSFVTLSKPTFLMWLHPPIQVADSPHSETEVFVVDVLKGEWKRYLPESDVCLSTNTTTHTHTHTHTRTHTHTHTHIHTHTHTHTHTHAHTHTHTHTWALFATPRFSPVKAKRVLYDIFQQRSRDYFFSRHYFKLCCTLL